MVAVSAGAPLVVGIEARRELATALGADLRSTEALVLIDDRFPPDAVMESKPTFAELEAVEADPAASVWRYALPFEYGAFARVRGDYSHHSEREDLGLTPRRESRRSPTSSNDVVDMPRIDTNVSLLSVGTRKVAVRGGRPMNVEVTCTGRVMTVTLARPEKLNALSYELIRDLHDAMDAAETDEGVRALILTGSGSRAFSAGADISDLARSVGDGVERALREVTGIGHGLTRRIENFPKPFIVAVNGMALGGGCEITEAAHLAVAAEHAVFGKPEITLGFPPPFGGSQRLARHAGRKRALEMVLTAEPITAVRAYEIGLVNRVVPADNLLEEARSLAEQICRHDPIAVAASLAAVTRGINLPIDEGLAVEAAWFANSVAAGAAQRGLAAFLDRAR